jgi:hypothetical protein
LTFVATGKKYGVGSNGKRQGDFLAARHSARESKAEKVSYPESLKRWEERISPKRGKMETYPFHHRNLFFQICTDYDLTFQEIRGILDFLLEAQAFEEDRRTSEEGQLYELQLEKVRYVVDVMGPNVVVYQRTEN